MYVRKIRCEDVDWNQVAENTTKLWCLVKTTVDLQVLQKAPNILTGKAPQL